MLKHGVMWCRRDETVAGILFGNKRENEMVRVRVVGGVTCSLVSIKMFGFSMTEQVKKVNPSAQLMSARLSIQLIPRTLFCFQP